MKLTELESQVLKMMLAGTHPVFALLRKQFEVLTVSSRELTGVGFFCDLAVEESLPIPGKPSFELSDVTGSAANLKEGMGFVLFVTDGALSMLEGFTYDEPWPEQVHNWKLTYRHGARDLPKFLDPN
jgi:hypothetical protein